MHQKQLVFQSQKWLQNLPLDTLDELKNEITKVTPASFEPSIDYIVTKIPRFTFEKFSTTPAELGTSMKSVGEAMAIGRNLKHLFKKL